MPVNLSPPPHGIDDVNSEEWKRWFFSLRRAILDVEAGDTVVIPGEGEGEEHEHDPQLTENTYTITSSQTVPANAQYILAYSTTEDVFLTIPANLESTYLHIKKMSSDVNDITVSANSGVDGGSVSMRFQNTAIMLGKTTDGWKVL